MRPFRPASPARWLVRLGLALLPLLAGCAGEVGVISGRVRLAQVTRDTVLVPRGSEHDPRATVVYVESIADTLRRWLRLPPGPDVVAIEQRTGGFSPAVVAVPAGGSLVYRNHDTVFHRAFARGPVDSFDTGNYRPGESRTVRMTDAARFPVFCVIHPDELGVVVVTPTRVFAQPGSDGTFRLPPLPYGRYEVRAWHPAYGEIRREVNVRDWHGTSLELDF